MATDIIRMAIPLFCIFVTTFAIASIVDTTRRGLKHHRSIRDQLRRLSRG